MVADSRGELGRVGEVIRLSLSLTHTLQEKKKREEKEEEEEEEKVGFCTSMGSS